MHIVIIIVFAILQCSYSEKIERGGLFIRGGIVPEADEDGEDYYEQYNLDYGRDDEVRLAGALRGVIKTSTLAKLPEKDPFFAWWNEYLENGPDEEYTDRLKPFYAADFGEREDLKRNENPKIIIVNRKLQTLKNRTTIGNPSDEIDVEIREIWQPWLKMRCNFVARYIVPNRANILKIMQAKGRFHSEIEVDKKSNGKNSRKVKARMVFKPNLIQKILFRKRDIIIDREIVNAERILK